ncbi:hypothetical protein IW140_006395 [Coemansia sp. RSA 1813]|nr:hypothetical protein LPJ74_006263 [Coemansia sp. RSA 1843]KAJ2085427.1 hypothetical protein IW138_006335 [Coemansia sp. RSA 986]KAJ2210326.1 hypothetical protein EV179_006318 [Coemansia sp. RSA 487]KAJ2562551.1 hypothetical protein IW140_006395 [Coemansia sp. RSA 1813]
MAFSEKRDNVKDYYGKVLSSSSGLRTSACSARAAPHPVVCKIIRTKIPDAVNERFYGCGNPIPLGIGGMDVLDLGSGSGRDSYVAAALVGPTGSVTGIDMTDEQLQVARTNVPSLAKALGFQPKLRFLAGYIEDLKSAGVASASVDLCISNCVVNLSPDKHAVLSSVFESLRRGGELHFADMYADRTVPAHLGENKVLHGEGLAGALFVADFERMACQIGFAHPRVLDAKRIDVFDPELRALVGDTQYYSVTYRLFKLDNNSAGGATGKVAVYRGTVDGCQDRYVLDASSSFDTGTPTSVGAETAAVLEGSWLARHFTFEPLLGFDDVAATESSAPTTLSMLQSL